MTTNNGGSNSTRNLRRQIESIKRQKIVSKKVVSLSEFRELRERVDQPTVLIVDDDEIMRKALIRIFEAEGFHVLAAQDGMELSNFLESSRLDLILLDVNLPWVSGYELCALIKSNQQLAKVPLVFVSARKEKEDIEAGFAAGCDDYITKPIDIDAITGTVRKLLKKSS